MEIFGKIGALPLYYFIRPIRALNIYDYSGQFSSLLSPPPAAMHLANTADRKAAIVLSNLKSGNKNMYSYSKDSSSIKACYF